MQPLDALGTAVGTRLWVQADDEATQGWDTGHCQKVRDNLMRKAVKLNFPAYFSPQSPGLRVGEAGHS